VRHFFANVAGESYRNDDDGSDRQTIITSCRVGEPLILDAEPDNPEDENAIRVLRRDGKQIGYIEREMAARLVDDLTDFSAYVAGVGRGGGPYLGVSLLMVVNDGETEAVVNAYARQTLEDEGNLVRSPVQGREAGRAGQRGRRTRRTPSQVQRSDRDVPLRWALLSLAGIAAAAAAAFWWFAVTP
jgi:hypothetical protein